MQVTPTLSVKENSILASFVDIRGSWIQGEFKARMFGSNDGGREWSEVDMGNSTMQHTSSGPKGASFALAATPNNANGFTVLTIHGYLNNVTSQLWNIEL